MNTTKLNISDGAEYPPEYYNLWSAIELLKERYIWIIFAFGFPGNLLSLFVIMRMSKSRLTTSLLYVALLAVVDNIAIILKVVENRIQVDKIPMTAVSCKVHHFLGNVFATYANWILIVMAAERYTAVRLPLRVGLIWSLKKAVVIVCVILIFLCLVQLHIFFTMTSINNKCRIYPEFSSFYYPWWFLIDSSFYGFIPAIIVTVMNFLIILCLRTSTIHRLSLLSNSNMSHTGGQQQARQATGMLITLSIVFIILTLPRCVYTIMWTYWKPVDETGRVRNYFLDLLTMNIADSNHAVNFYLYFLSGRSFRRYILCLFHCKKHQDLRGSSVRNRPTGCDIRTKISEVLIAETNT